VGRGGEGTGEGRGEEGREKETLGPAPLHIISGYATATRSFLLHVKYTLSYRIASYRIHNE